MNNKLKHPANRAERLKIKVRKSKIKEHSNASPVWKLLKEKEVLDALNKEERRLP